MNEFLEAFKKGDWKMIIIIALLAVTTGLMGVLAITLPAKAKEAVEVQLGKTVEPLVEKITSLDGEIKQVKEMLIDSFKGSAIAGYKKVTGATEEEWLKILTKSHQSTEAIRNGLQYEDIRNELVAYDPKKTKFFCEFFNIDP